MFFCGCSTASKVAVPPASSDAEGKTTAFDPAAKWRDLDLKKYPNANTILLDDIEKVTYNPDGTYTRSDEYFTLICTEKGRDDNRTIALHFNEFYEKIPSVEINLIKPDGKVVKPILQKKISVESSQMQSNIYDPANKVFAIGIPGLEVGDIVHYKFKQETVRPRMQNVWCTITMLQNPDPILHYSYTISAPENTPLTKIAVKNEVKGTLKKSVKPVNGRIIYNFEANNVPQVFPEPDMPPWYLHSMRILASTVPDWQTVSRWYYNLCMPHIKAVSPELTRKAKSLAAGKNEKAAIRAMFDFVSKEIRYTGVTNENTAPGYEPHDVKDTFAQKHGVCRDKAALLAAMLLEAGFDAFPVLFMAGDPKDFEVPNNYFNHAITGVKTSSGELILMDPTDENSIDMLPAYAMDKSFLCATSSGDILRKTSVVPAEKNLLRIKSAGIIDKEQALQLKSTLLFEGINDNVYRSAFARWTPAYREQFIASAMKRVLPGAEIKSVKVLPENIRDLARPFELVIECTVKDFASIKMNAGMLGIPFIGRGFGFFNFMVGDSLLKSRKYPMRFESTAGVVEDCIITLPEDLSVAALPDYKEVKVPALTVDFDISAKGKVLTGKRHVKLNTVEIATEDYAKFLEAVENISFSDKRKIVAERKFPDKTLAASGADSVMLNKDCQVKFTSRSEFETLYTVKLQVLNYSGIKEYSELTLDYVTGLTTAEFKSVKVTSPTGKVKIVDLKDVKVMDDPVSAAAPRYPAGKKLVLPLPGVEVGSVVEYTCRLTSKAAGDSCALTSLAGFLPIKNVKVQYSYPARLARQFKLLLPESGFTIEQGTSGFYKTVTVTGQDIPMYKEEPSVPPIELFAPVAGISEFDSARYSEELLAAFKKAAKTSAKIDGLAAMFIEKYPDLRSRVRAIRDHVAKNIRRAGLDINVLGCKYITQADTTLRDGYGNSIDRAVLLYTLLKAAKIENISVVLASGVPDLDIFRRQFMVLPQNVFGSVLLRVSLNGEDFYLNDSNEYAELGSCDHENTLGLDLNNGELITIESSPGYAAENRQFLQIKALDGNAAEITVSEYFYGTDHAGTKKFFDRITPEEERQYWEQKLSGFLAGAELVSVKKELDKYPGMISYQVKHPDFWQSSGNYVSFKLPTILGNVFRTAGKRSLPYLRFAAENKSLECEVTLLKDWKDCKLIIPDVERDLPGNTGNITRTCEITADNTLIFKEKAVLKPFYMDAASYVLLENLQKELSDPAKLTILFKTSGK